MLYVFVLTGNLIASRQGTAYWRGTQQSSIGNGARILTMTRAWDPHPLLRRVLSLTAGLPIFIEFAGKPIQQQLSAAEGLDLLLPGLLLRDEGIHVFVEDMSFVAGPIRVPPVHQPICTPHVHTLLELRKLRLQGAVGSGLFTGSNVSPADNLQRVRIDILKEAVIIES